MVDSSAEQQSLPSVQKHSVLQGKVVLSDTVQGTGSLASQRFGNKHVRQWPTVRKSEFSDECMHANAQVTEQLTLLA